MTVGSLFTGVGGIDLGLEWAGFDIRWQVEVDEFCRAQLEREWPHVKRYRDVHTVGAQNLEPVDLIAGGFPCQPVSLAGRRAGERDDRWLWPEFARVLREVRPRIALMENVPGLLVRGMGEVLGDLAEAGYDAEWCVLGADDVGAPHIRKRVFIIASLADAEGQPVGSGLRPGREGGERRRRSGHGGGEDGWWASEPAVGRVAHGVPHRVDRLRALGNAVVPQVAAFLGHQIAERYF